jgi:hypothetical protein
MYCFFTSLFITSYISIFPIVTSQHSPIPHSDTCLSLQHFYLKKHRVKPISAENFTQIWFRCLVLPTCLRKNINQFKVKLKSIYQNLVETTFDTNNYCRPTLVSWLLPVRDDILLFYISHLSPVSLSTYLYRLA